MTRASCPCIVVLRSFETHRQAACATARAGGSFPDLNAPCAFREHGLRHPHAIAAPQNFNRPVQITRRHRREHPGADSPPPALSRLRTARARAGCIRTAAAASPGRDSRLGRAAQSRPGPVPGPLYARCVPSTSTAHWTSAATIAAPSLLSFPARANAWAHGRTPDF